MYYLPGILVVLGGLIWALNNQGVIGFPEFNWTGYGSILAIIAGIGLIVLGAKIRQLKGRMAKRLGGILAKIDSLYESSILKSNSTDSEFGEMHEIIKLHADASPLYRASKLWEALFVRHIRWLRENGISNFKRSVNLGYFQWKISFKDNQLVSTLQQTNPVAILKNFLKIRITAPLTDDVGTTRQDPFVYRLFMAGLVEKTKSVDRSRLFGTIEEPLSGNPWLISYEGRPISQDICNSLIEYSNISNEVALSSPLVMAELGAGYGRLAYIFLKARHDVKYVIFDIPPAIFISQWYLSQVFPDKKIFKVKSFTDFQDIRQEYEQSDIAFFLPEQLEFFPDKHFNLFINISSLGEMRMDQIKNYFSQIGRLTHGYFYTKQWITSVNSEDNLIIRQQDYPVLPSWKRIYERPAAVQKKFFEALYKIENPGSESNLRSDPMIP